MDEEDIPLSSQEVRAAFQIDSTITDLEFLDFWESLTTAQKLEFRANAIRMGFLSMGRVVFRFPNTYAMTHGLA